MPKGARLGAIRRGRILTPPNAKEVRLVLMAMVVERKVYLPNSLGLHARPAMLLVEMANRFMSEITLSRDVREVDCKNMIAVLTLGAEQGAEILIAADGDDAEEAVESLSCLVEIGFGEE